MELPRKDVADHLEKIDPLVCIRFIEYLIEEREEESHQFHDRLAELYLRTTLIAKKRQDTSEPSRRLCCTTNPNVFLILGLQDEMYSKLLHFIDTTNHFRIDWFYGVISSEGRPSRDFSQCRSYSGSARPIRGPRRTSWQDGTP